MGFGGRGLSALHHSSMLMAWASVRDGLYSDVVVDAKCLHYNAKGKAARELLMREKGWLFKGDGEMGLLALGCGGSATGCRYSPPSASTAYH